MDVEAIRADFPILDLVRNGNPLVYLDNGATSQTPRCVMDAIEHYYAARNANVHRGVHYLSQAATHDFEEARKKAGRFIGTPLACEVIFTRGTTEAINLVAQSYGRTHVGAGDEVLISYMEHHSNIVPWQMLCEEKGAHLKVIPINDAGELDMDAFERLLNERTKIVAVTHVSNALGTITPIKEIIRIAHSAGVPVLLDGAQAIPHMPINVYELGCDFYAFSAHKMYGPTGMGVLYGKARLLDAMPPWQGGGDMIMSVTFEKTTYNTLPYKFEAGTPNIEGAIALGAAVDYLERLGMNAIAAHEHQLLTYATRALQEVPGLTIIGTAKEKAAVISFVLESAHPHDIGQLLDDAGIAVRAGHHCAQPVMQRFGIPATTRASLALYNTREEIDALVAALHNVNKVFG
ncbi:MAG: cysteine desulfurase [Candidatus Hydrogenedentes bacterium]|nr:cysteine desulfurase [Candidatus Hydrogenedentota bacterium]